MFFFVTVVTAIIVTVTHPISIGQTMFIATHESFAIFSHIQTTDALIAAVHAMFGAIANHFQRQTQTVLLASEFFVGAFEFLVVWLIVCTIVFIIIFGTVVVTVTP